MSGRELAAHVVVVLVLLMPSGVLAQLPDAPTPADSVQGARYSASEPSAMQNSSEDFHSYGDAVPVPSHRALARMGQPGDDTLYENALQRGWVTNSAEWPAETARGFSSSDTGPREVAFVDANGFDAQQSFARSPKRQFRPTLSSSTAYSRDVPGAAPALQNTCPVNFCPVQPLDTCCQLMSSPFEQYLTWPDVAPLTARDNLRSAVRGVIDPFNLITIGGDAAVGIGSDSHSPYGPGFKGFAKYAGVSFTEDMTGEFFGTFLVPSLVHQDPHYHREPFMPIRHRILHAMVQVLWSQSYTGKPMFNYANVVGGIATAAVSNTFVPGPDRQGFGNTAQRLALAFAISPSGNFIEEFVPDLASHVNLRVVIFQRILNTVTLEESGVAP